MASEIRKVFDSAVTRTALENSAFRHTHRDYKGGRGKERSVLRLNPNTGGTESVRLSSLTDLELLEKLPKSEREAIWGEEREPNFMMEIVRRAWATHGQGGPGDFGGTMNIANAVERARRAGVMGFELDRIKREALSSPPLPPGTTRG